MKKIITLVCVAFLGTLAFANENQTYVTAAYNFALFTERGDNARTEIVSHGIDLSVSTYFNQNWGLYLNTGYYFPSKTTTTSGGSTVTLTSSDWDFSMYISMILGPSYRYSITKDFEVFGGLGIHFAEYSLKIGNIASALVFSFGIGGDAGVRYAFTDNFYVTGGLIFSHDFLGFGEATTIYGTTKQSGSYNLGSIRPYIGVGVRYKSLLM
ncbi:MAG: outer membrane beta-barrel protein [Treponema sp.]|nr:outer membrane beta-barrel protein [Treponema sp.]